MISPIDLINVAKHYSGKPHQNVAIAYLQSKIPTDVLIKFAELWRTAPKPEQLISMQQAIAIFGRSPAADQLADLNSCLVRFNITTPQRMRHFIGQIAHESGGLQWLQELATGDDYEWREDLGNVRLGDGRKYKGAGAIQLTGRSNYQAFADYMKDQSIMQGCSYVAAKYPFTSAGFWWMNNNMNVLCDSGANVETVARRVNGGTNGLEDRIAYYAKACAVLGDKA